MIYIGKFGMNLDHFWLCESPIENKLHIYRTLTELAPDLKLSSSVSVDKLTKFYNFISTNNITLKNDTIYHTKLINDFSKMGYKEAYEKIGKFLTLK